MLKSHINMSSGTRVPVRIVTTLNGEKHQFRYGQDL